VRPRRRPRRRRAARRHERRPRHPTGTLAATILGSSLAFIDGSVVNVALPRSAATSAFGGGDMSWLINAYLLPVGSVVLLGGVAGDRWGRKRMFLAGMALFTLASLACALAPASACCSRPGPSKASAPRS
jgi:MFS family permease